MKSVGILVISLLLIITIVVPGCAGQTLSTSASQQPQTIKTQQGKISLKFSDQQPAQSYFGLAAIAWAKTITDASNGKVEITTFSGETLVKQQDQYDAVLSGLCDIALMIPDVTPGRFPLSGIDTLPMLYPSGECLASVYWDILQKYYVKTDLSKVKLLWVEAYPPSQVISKKPVQKLDDFKGLKWRIEGKVEGWTMEALGASGSLISMSETYTALDKGVVDGINFLWEGVLAFGFNQIVNYRTESDLLSRGMIIVMNLDKWNSLPPDVQALFNQYGGKEYSITAGAAGDKAMQESKKVMVKIDGMLGNPPIYVIPPEEKARWVQVCQTVQDRWAKEKDAAGLPGSAIIADTRELVNRYTSK
jgi:TRAP-type transport system periplasmic protein